MTSPSQRVRFSIVIASRDRKEQLWKCLESICNAKSPDDEIIVVDSASGLSDSLHEIASSFGARFLRAPAPGAARARNIGIRESRGEFIAVTDDDAVVERDWLDALASALSDPSVHAVVGPVFQLGAVEPSLLLPLSNFDAAKDRIRFSRSEPGWFEKLRYGAIGFGANLAVRRSGLERFGLFREGLGAGAAIGGDENYFLLSLVDNGGTVVNEPSARVYHPPVPDARLRLIREHRLAYVMYVFWTRPSLRGYILRHALTRRKRTLSTTISSPGLLREAINAPRLLRRALRTDKQSTSLDSPERKSLPAETRSSGPKTH